MLAPVPAPVGHTTGAVSCGKLYVIGGQDSSGTIVSAVQVYDPIKNTWSAFKPLPTATAFLDAVEVHCILYALGGETTGFPDGVSTNLATEACRVP
jgi:N-acetylneuraminic acid mutarotase